MDSCSEAERAYWRRKLPPAFRFFLEMLTRELIDANGSCHPYSHAAAFFEELLVQRDMELCLLPDVTFLDKMKKKAGIEPRAATGPGVPEVAGGRCAVCGGVRPASAGDKALGSHSTCRYCGCSGAAPPRHVSRSPSPEPCVRCARCGCTIKSPGVRGAGGGGGGGGGGQRRDGHRDGEYNIITRPFNKDAWGRMVGRRCLHSDESPIINCRSLAILVDY